MPDITMCDGVRDDRNDFDLADPCVECYRRTATPGYRQSFFKEPPAHSLEGGEWACDERMVRGPQ